jgi:hypothetical protein
VQLSHPHHPKTAWGVNLCEWGNTPSQREGRKVAHPKASKISLTQCHPAFLSNSVPYARASRAFVPHAFRHGPLIPERITGERDVPSVLAFIPGTLHPKMASLSGEIPSEPDTKPDIRLRALSCGLAARSCHQPTEACWRCGYPIPAGNPVLPRG